MHIILGDNIANELRERHTVLELETFTVGNTSTTAYCVLRPTAELIPEMADLERLCRLHKAFVDAFNEKRYDTALDAVEHLRGKFAGELDSFYSTICDKIKAINDTDR